MIGLIRQHIITSSVFKLGASSLPRHVIVRECKGRLSLLAVFIYVTTTGSVRASDKRVLP
jgi:hypothetical protein